MKYKHAKLTDIGNYRKMNQDNLDFFENSRGEAFGIVCDGMGGHAHGEVASKMAVDKFAKIFESQNFDGLDNNQINRWLRNSVTDILNDMIDYADQDLTTKDMGTTLTAILFANNCAYVINVGDSRTYKVVDNRLFQVSQDQNLWNSTPEAERKDIQMSGMYDKATEVTFWKVLTSALGPAKTLRIDTYFIEDPKGIYILTTDGVHDYMDEDIVVSTLLNPKQKMKEKAHLIIEDAKDNMSTDNLSILIIEVE
ncbi:PP2C family protein-serine/threonine phosphatase [Spiroplasma alleghenense]|uniref:Phosphorylated protein phosphatase n=1 Tax=Spiroplasma alleghenense TaxID=216931 RepID=A0A345Z421_9MOLU|nr:protein phosphatase 2C domain-containing protein [Spiroplasma alleghenense]AXK51350.1 phosphorylated protein phosphatase [Spiroplasma alleghenense]